MAEWTFIKHDGYGDINASTTADSFIDRSIKDMATALVREGVQNAMDARRSDLPDDEPVRVRLTLGRAGGGNDPQPVNQRWFGQLFRHLEQSEVGAPEHPEQDEACDVLIFEDFGTTGLTGDHSAPYKPGTPNNFVNFLYHEGVTGKGNKQLGSRGVGKVVFTMASRARTFFAFTVRDNSPDTPLLVGKNVLKFREIDQKLYQGPAYFVDKWKDKEPRQPVSDGQTLTAFAGDFPISRERDSGLSVVIPFLDESVDAEALRRAIIAEYYYAILAGKLELTLDDHGSIETFNATHLPDSGDPSVDAEIELARWSLSRSTPPDLATLAPQPNVAQRLEAELVSEQLRGAVADQVDQGERVAVRVPLHIHPRDGQPVETSFDVFLEHSDAFSTRPTFVRELLPISDVRDAKSASHIRALVVIHEGPLANMLRAAEGPNHTDWSPQRDRFKESYTARKGEIRFVAQAVRDLIGIVRGDDNKPVGGIATPFFSVIREDEPKKAAKKTKGKGKKGEGNSDPPDPNPKGWRLDKVEGGFVVRPGAPEASPPKRLVIRVAYNVIRGSAWSQWEPSDFDFDNEAGEINFVSRNATIDTAGGKGNRFVLEVLETNARDFEVYVTGFDTNRDLIIDDRPDRAREPNDAHTPELHPPQEVDAR